MGILFILNCLFYSTGQGNLGCHRKGNLFMCQSKFGYLSVMFYLMLVIVGNYDLQIKVRDSLDLGMVQ